MSLLCWLLVAVSHAQSAPASANATVRFRARAITQGGVLVDVPFGSSLHTGDKLWFEVEITRAMHIYVVQLFPDGGAALLYPQAKPVKSQPHVITRIPANAFDSFQLDSVTGRERVLLIATTAPLSKSDAALAALVDEISKKRSWPSSEHTSQPTPMQRKRPDHANIAPAGYIEPSFRTRGIRLASDTNELRMATDAQGVAVGLFEFDHLPSSERRSN